MSIYDDRILAAIKDKFMTAAEISEATGVSYSRVSICLNNLRKHNMVEYVQATSEARGVKPYKYRAKAT